MLFVSPLHSHYHEILHRENTILRCTLCFSLSVLGLSCCSIWEDSCLAILMCIHLWKCQAPRADLINGGWKPVSDIPMFFPQARNLHRVPSRVGRLWVAPSGDELYSVCLDWLSLFCCPVLLFPGLHSCHLGTLPKINYLLTCLCLGLCILGKRGTNASAVRTVPFRHQGQQSLLSLPFCELLESRHVKFQLCWNLSCTAFCFLIVFHFSRWWRKWLHHCLPTASQLFSHTCCDVLPLMCSSVFLGCLLLALLECISFWNSLSSLFLFLFHYYS